MVIVNLARLECLDLHMTGKLRIMQQLSVAKPEHLKPLLVKAPQDLKYRVG